MGRERVRIMAMPAALDRREAEMAGWALAFAALTGMGALLRVPLAPVPATAQVLFALLAGLALGPAWGPASQAAYVLMGLCGAPFFAAPPYAGPAVLFGPTGGYLWGFVLAAWAAGLAGERARRAAPAVPRFALTLAASLAGVLAVHACGAAWLAAWLGAQGKGSWLAYSLGFKPFIAADLLKGLAGSVLFLGGDAAFRRHKRKRLG